MNVPLPSCFSKHCFSLLIATALALSPGLAMAEEEFPPVTAEDQAFKQVAGFPHSPAVILFEKGDFWMLDPAKREVSSRLHIQTRMKILTEEGMDLAKVTVSHSSYSRFKNFEGRTILPSGKIVPLEKDAVFKRVSSRSLGRYETSVAFPAVEVGAILDYQYDIFFDSIAYLNPWHFQRSIPVLHSEIVYHVPGSVAVQTWGRELKRAGVTGIQSEKERTGRGTDMRVWMDNLPPIPDEPLGAPQEDFSSKYMIIPYVANAYGQDWDLLKDWKSTCTLFEDHYSDAMKKGGKAKKKAKELAKSMEGQPNRAIAEACYRYVRDEIDTVYRVGVGTVQNHTVDKVIKDGRASFVEKALILQVMLKAIKVPSQMVWAPDRWSGMIDTRVANPAWFEKVLVQAEFDDGVVYLDPSDSDLAFGKLAPDVEGMEALLFDRKKPELTTLPETTYEENRRHAKIELAVNDEGVVSGKGALAYTGQAAWSRLHWDQERWTEWLGESFGDYVIGDILLNPAVDDGRLDVSWNLKQREETVLGDEVLLSPCQPLGPSDQPLTQSVSERIMPVMLYYPTCEELEFSITWPEGWAVESHPEALSLDITKAAARVETTLDAAQRRFEYSRRLDLRNRKHERGEEYDHLRNLFAAVEKVDGQGIVLVRR